MVEDHGESRIPLSADRLELSGMVAVVLLGVAAIGGVLVPVIPWLARHRGAVQTSQSLVQSLPLSSTAWVGSGRARRWPGSSHPGVDLRASPAIPAIDTSPAGLLVARPPRPHSGQCVTSREQPQ
jgi:hypothetical protein